MVANGDGTSSFRGEPLPLHGSPSHSPPLIAAVSDFTATSSLPPPCPWTSLLLRSTTAFCVLLLLAEYGTKVLEDGIIETFDNDDEALDAVDNRVAVADLSYFGRIRVSGDDRIQFLHNQSTANFERLHIGQVLKNLNLGDLIGKPYGTHQHYNVNGMPITVGVGNAISEEGYSLLISQSAAGTVLKTLVSEGAVPVGSRAWEKLRIIKGRPAPGKELTDEFNVLEAGLWNSISQDKGCYKGQETIARLITYNGVKQRLWGINLSALAEPGSPITVDGKKVGKLTSYTSGRREGEHFSLGYIKKQVSEGNTVNVGDNIVGTVVEVSFLAQQVPPTAPPAVPLVTTIRHPSLWNRWLSGN